MVEETRGISREDVRDAEAKCWLAKGSKWKRWRSWWTRTRPRAAVTRPRWRNIFNGGCLGWSTTVHCFLETPHILFSRAFVLTLCFVFNFFSLILFHIFFYLNIHKYIIMSLLFSVTNHLLFHNLFIFFVHYNVKWIILHG